MSFINYREPSPYRTRAVSTDFYTTERTVIEYVPRVEYVPVERKIIDIHPVEVIEDYNKWMPPARKIVESEKPLHRTRYTTWYHGRVPARYHYL